MKVKISPVFDARQNDNFNKYGEKECATPYTFMIDIGGFKYFPSTGNGSECGYSTKSEADIARKTVIDNIENYLKNTVFLVQKNVDFTEGRGPMVVIRLYKKAKDAHEFIMRQDGIYGSKQYQSISLGVNIREKLYGYISYNGYDIKVMKLL